MSLIFECFISSETSGCNNPHQGEAGIGRKEVRSWVQDHGVQAGSCGFVVEGKQADQKNRQKCESSWKKYVHYSYNWSKHL